jgi:hypothetical protein
VRTALLSAVPLLREAGQGDGRGFDEVVWVRGQGYDPLVPPRRPEGLSSPTPTSTHLRGPTPFNGLGGRVRSGG